MKELPLRLRVYLWGIYLAFVVLVAQQVCLLGRVDAGLPTLISAAAFVLLAYIGERVSLQISGSITQSLSTAIHVAAILVLPQPYPLVISLGAVVVSHGFDRGRPLYKRAFNVCHPTLTVGLTTALLGLIAAPTTVLRAHHLVNAFPYLVLVLVVYYALDVGILLAVLSLADAAAPWRVWLHTYRPTLLPELAASTIGILGAIAWQYDPLALTLLVFPIVALRIAYRAINQAEDRGAALRRRGEQLEAVLAAGQRLRLQPASGDLLAPVAEAARAVSGPRRQRRRRRDLVSAGRGVADDASARGRQSRRQHPGRPGRVACIRVLQWRRADRRRRRSADPYRPARGRGRRRARLVASVGRALGPGARRS